MTHQCKKCNDEGVFYKTQFNVVAKTFYKLKDSNEMLCFRHWHQSDRPKSDFSGDYTDVVNRIKGIKTNVTSLTSRDF